MQNHLLLIDYRDGETAYEEYDNIRVVNSTFELYKNDVDIEYMRIVYTDGTVTMWDNPNFIN